MKRKVFSLMVVLSFSMAVTGQIYEETLPNPDNEPAPVHPVPSQRQLLWQETEFYAFFHFGMNTFTNAEWGDGSEAESKFAPTKVPNPRQWLEAVKAAGMKGGIAVVKHHDGFCLWPTATTTHSIVNAGNENGRLPCARGIVSGAGSIPFRLKVLSYSKTAICMAESHTNEPTICPHSFTSTIILSIAILLSYV